MTDDGFGSFIVLIILIALFTGPAILVDRWWKSETINRGLAQYCTNTGKWAWVGECAPFNEGGE